MRNQIYYILAAVMAVALLPSTGYTKEADAKTQKGQVSPTKLIPFELDKSIGISIHSSPVKSNQKEVCLLNSGKIKFHLDPNLRLTATVNVSTTNGWTDLPAVVDYAIHAAVFDDKGTLLGTASVPYKINPSSIASGRVAIASFLPMDFGKSLNYDKARYFAIAVNEPEIKQGVGNEPQNSAGKNTKTKALMGIESLELEKLISVSVPSTPIKVNDKATFHLLYLSRIQFHLSAESHLTAMITSASTEGLTMLPHNVDYTVHTAVFDEQGKLLGTANSPCKVHPGYSVGSVAVYLNEVAMDLGISLNYGKAKYFTLAISEPDIKKRGATQSDEAATKRQ